MTLFHDHDAISICLLTWLRNRTRTPPSLISVRAVKGAGIVNNVKIAHIPTVLIFLSGLVEKLDQLGGLLIQLRLGHTDQSHVSASLDV